MEQRLVDRKADFQGSRGFGSSPRRLHEGYKEPIDHTGFQNIIDDWIVIEEQREWPDKSNDIADKWAGLKSVARRLA